MYTKAYMGLLGGSGSPLPVSPRDRSFARSNTRTKTEGVNSPSILGLSCSSPAVSMPRRDTPPSGQGVPRPVAPGYRPVPDAPQTR